MIRKHTKEDLEQLISIWAQANKAAHPFLDGEFVNKVASDMRNIYLPDSATWVYEDNGKPIGFISMVENEIVGLFVNPAMHSKGTGTKLVDYIHEEKPVLEVEVFEKNEIGRGFYNKYGFKKISQYFHEESQQTIYRMQFNKNGA